MASPYDITRVTNLVCSAVAALLALIIGGCLVSLNGSLEIDNREVDPEPVVIEE